MRYIPYLVCLVLVGGAAFGPLGEAAAAGPADLLVHAGMNVSTVHLDDLIAKSRRGLALGVGTCLRLSDDFCLLPEVWYMQKGIRGSVAWELVTLETRYQTISVPVLLALQFPAARFESRAFIGPAIDWVLANEIRRKELQAWQAWHDVADQAEDLYVSLIVGGGTRYGRLDLEVRYQHGLSKLSDYRYREFLDVMPAMTTSKPAYDRTWTFSVGYWF
jgi:hypothetical protein